MGDTLEGRRLVISVMYEGPWERFMNWLWAIDPATNELRREVKAGSLRNWLAGLAEDRHRRWVDRYAADFSEPNPRWRRRLAPEHNDGAE